MIEGNYQLETQVEAHHSMLQHERRRTSCDPVWILKEMNV